MGDYWVRVRANPNPNPNPNPNLNPNPIPNPNQVTSTFLKDLVVGDDEVSISSNVHCRRYVVLLSMLSTWSVLLVTGQYLTSSTTY